MQAFLFLEHGHRLPGFTLHGDQSRKGFRNSPTVLIPISQFLAGHGATRPDVDVPRQRDQQSIIADPVDPADVEIPQIGRIECGRRIVKIQHHQEILTFDAAHT